MMPTGALFRKSISPASGNEFDCGSLVYTDPAEVKRARIVFGQGRCAAEKTVLEQNQRVLTPAGARIRHSVSKMLLNSSKETPS
jgi:hypothetical protein